MMTRGERCRPIPILPTSRGLILLETLASGPRSVRELVIEGDGRIKRNTAYKTLERLEGAGLVRMRRRPGRSTTWCLTRASRLTLDAWRERIENAPLVREPARVLVGAEEERGRPGHRDRRSPDVVDVALLPTLERLCIELAANARDLRTLAWFVDAGDGWLERKSAATALRRLVARGRLVAVRRAARSSGGRWTTGYRIGDEPGTAGAPFSPTESCCERTKHRSDRDG